jgi:prephenate dehydrogenase
MTVGIIGAGLIGGSFAKAYKAAGHRVLVQDTDKSTEEFAILSGAADASFDRASGCDLILLCVYPNAAIEFLRDYGEGITSTVIDCCGTKKNVCAAGFALAEKHGFTFVGGHPMAGKEQSGFKHSTADLFEGASMMIVPPAEKVNDIAFLDMVKSLLAPARLGRITVTTADKHDEMIAFTSQLAHLVSNSFIKSPAAVSHKGYSAGSYRDLTRVAWLNEDMWTELFMENRTHLLGELNTFIGSLNEYKSALESEDSGKLRQLLYDGKMLKEKVDRQ